MPYWNMEAAGDAAALAAGCGLVYWITRMLRLATRQLWRRDVRNAKKPEFSLEDEFYLHSIHVRL